MNNCINLDLLGPFCDLCSENHSTHLICYPAMDDMDLMSMIIVLIRMYINIVIENMDLTSITW